MKILGITGGIGSGKTTITGVFSLFNIPVYIADIESKRLTVSSLIIKDKLIAAFGADLYTDSGLNKPLLASCIFGNESNLALVNSIIHPEVKADFRDWIDRNLVNDLLILESAILFESGFDELVDYTIVVHSPFEERVSRVMSRDNLSKEDVLKRVNSQMSDDTKNKLADFIVLNDNYHSVIQQVIGIIDEINMQK